MSSTVASSLRHEHIVRINDPINFAGNWLTREQLWAGLVHTLTAPQESDDSVDQVSIESLSTHCFRREIKRGAQVFRDEFTLYPLEAMQVRASAGGALAGSTLTIRIEEPAPEMLFVRFTYELRGLEPIRDQAEDRARCSAYQNADIDRIRAARRYVQHAAKSLQ